MDEIIFQLDDVHFSYFGKFPALCGVTLSVRKGEKIAVMGANGTGKSTLLAMLDGLIFPDRGGFKALGRSMSAAALQEETFSRSFRGAVGYCFQNPDIQLFCPTVQEDIMFGPLQLGVAAPEIKARLDKLTALLGISHLLDRAPYQLSIGEKRKVSLASVFIMEPDVILLDEPTAGLDPATTRHIVDIIIQSQESGKTVVTSTHDLHIIEEIADTVHVFGAGKNIVRSGESCCILADEAFLREHNLIHIHRHRHKDKVHTHPHVHIEHHDADEHA